MRLTFARWFRKKFSGLRHQKIAWSDEKMFDVDGQMNSKNDVIYAESREEANMIGRLHEKRKYPLKVMVFCFANL